MSKSTRRTALPTLKLDQASREHLGKDRGILTPVRPSMAPISGVAARAVTEKDIENVLIVFMQYDNVFVNDVLNGNDTNGSSPKLSGMDHGFMSQATQHAHQHQQNFACLSRAHLQMVCQIWPHLDFPEEKLLRRLDRDGTGLFTTIDALRAFFPTTHLSTLRHALHRARRNTRREREMDALPPVTPEIMDVFRRVDQAHKGYITIQDLRRVLSIPEQTKSTSASLLKAAGMDFCNVIGAATEKDREAWDLQQFVIEASDEYRTLRQADRLCRNLLDLPTVLRQAHVSEAVIRSLEEEYGITLQRFPRMWLEVEEEVLPLLRPGESIRIAHIVEFLRRFDALSIMRVPWDPVDLTAKPPFPTVLSEAHTTPRGEERAFPDVEDIRLAPANFAWLLTLKRDRYRRGWSPLSSQKKTLHQKPHEEEEDVVNSDKNEEEVRSDTAPEGGGPSSPHRGHRTTAARRCSGVGQLPSESTWPASHRKLHTLHMSEIEYAEYHFHLATKAPVLPFYYEYEMLVEAERAAGRGVPHKCVPPNVQEYLARVEVQRSQSQPPQAPAQSFLSQPQPLSSSSHSLSKMRSSKHVVQRRSAAVELPSAGGITETQERLLLYRGSVTPPMAQGHPRTTSPSSRLPHQSKSQEESVPVESSHSSEEDEAETSETPQSSTHKESDKTAVSSVAKKRFKEYARNILQRLQSVSFIQSNEEHLLPERTNSSRENHGSAPQDEERKQESCIYVAGLHSSKIEHDETEHNCDAVPSCFDTEAPLFSFAKGTTTTHSDGCSGNQPDAFEDLVKTRCSDSELVSESRTRRPDSTRRCEEISQNSWHSARNPENDQGGSMRTPLEPASTALLFAATPCVPHVSRRLRRTGVPPQRNASSTSPSRFALLPSPASTHPFESCGSRARDSSPPVRRTLTRHFCDSEVVIVPNARFSCNTDPSARQRTPQLASQPLRGTRSNAHPPPVPVVVHTSRVNRCLPPHSYSIRTHDLGNGFRPCTSTGSQHSEKARGFGAHFVHTAHLPVSSVSSPRPPNRSSFVAAEESAPSCVRRVEEAAPLSAIGIHVPHTAMNSGSMQATTHSSRPDSRQCTKRIQRGGGGGIRCRAPPSSPRSAHSIPTNQDLRKSPRCPKMSRKAVRVVTQRDTRALRPTVPNVPTTVTITVVQQHPSPPSSVRT